MIKGSMQEEDIILVSIYTPNIGARKYIKQILTDMKGEVGNNTIIVGNLNTPLTSMDRKINKATVVIKTQLISWF